MAALLVKQLFFLQGSDAVGGNEIARWWTDLKGWVPGLIGGGGFIGTVYKLARAATRRLDTKLDRYVKRPDYANKLSFLTSFHEDFRDYVETHVSAGERVFVLVDDLDRCEPMQAAELLKAINLMIPETLQLVFIIAVDRLKVAAGIAASQEKLLPFILADRRTSPDAKIDHAAAISYGYEFLEKFVQLPFRLPRMGAHNVAPFAAALVGKTMTISNETAGVAPRSRNLEDVVATDSPLVKDVLATVAPVLGYNPRRLKQFLNLFRLRHYVLDSTGWRRAGEPTLMQLGKVVVLEIRWPRFVDAVLSRPSLLPNVEKLAENDPPDTRAGSPALDSDHGAAVVWLRDEHLGAFLREGGEAARIGGLDLGAILGAAPLNVDVAVAVVQKLLPVTQKGVNLGASRWA